MASAVSRKLASVLDDASSTRSVWLIARVSQVPAMPAAAQLAGGDQHVVQKLEHSTGQYRFCKETDAMTVAAPRSTCKNSAADVLPEWYCEPSPAAPSTALPGS